MLAVSSAVAFMAIILTMSSSSAYDFYVGGRDGWVANPSEPFNHWAERNRFQVNDTLVFRFKREEDSVLVVNEADYRECNLSNPLMKLEEEKSVFKLERSGAFFFVSGAAGKCREGQKLLVVVLAVRRRAAGPSPAAAGWAASVEAASPAAANSAAACVARSMGIAAAGLFLSRGVFLF